MSSHKEAPAIAKDPVADSTDVYAFVSPDGNNDTVTIIANYVPLQDPDGGPNFAEFGAKTNVNGAVTGDDVLYEIHIVNDGSGKPAITYQFLFQTQIIDTTTFLYNTGPITYSNGTYANWNRPQTYTVTKVTYPGGPGTAALSTPVTPAGGASCPPCNVGIRSTPNYQTLSAPAVYTLITGEKVFAGQRAEGFLVDLGAIFDLADIRPLSPDHLIAGTATTPINALTDKNVHSIALQIPIGMLTSNGVVPTGPNDPHAVIGIYTTASRQTMRSFDPTTGVTTPAGNYNQVSRLGSPLVNEAVVPMASKDYFNSQPPANDSQFAAAVQHPELQSRLVELYPTAFPNLAAYVKAGTARADLVAIFATGIPGSLIAPSFGVGTYQGTNTIAEMLRLNVAIPQTATSGQDPGASNLGLLGNDLAGFPNGRRLLDDVVSIELAAVAGKTIPLVDSTYTPDGAVQAVLTSGVTPSTRSYQAAFPYLADPHGGFSNPTATPPSAPAPN